MNFSITGYWSTKHTKMVFPVITSPDLQTVNDYNRKVPSNWPNGWKNDSTLADIMGTTYGELLAVALALPVKKGINFTTVREISDEKGHSALLGAAKYPDGALHYLTVGTGTSWSGSDNMAYWNLDTDSGLFPESYKQIMILYLPKDKKLFVVDGIYTIGGDHTVLIRKSTYDSYTWITELSRSPSDINTNNGTLTDDPPKPPGPYEPGGDSGEGGGGGTFDGDSDQIPDSSLPTLSAADTGFTRLYTPTLAQVQNLARYLWTDESIIETLWNVVKRYFEDPMQAFISFSIVPVPVPVAGVEDFKVLFIPTGVMLNTVANQFVDVDCGTFEMKEYYGSALDYSPNTKVSCYLPYIGTVSLNTDDVMGRTLQVKYRVDICSGSCVAKILVDGNVIYQFPGCCSVPIPFTSADFSSYGSAIISAVKTGVALAAAGAGATELGANIIGMNASQQTGESYTKTTVDTVRNPATGRQITAGTQKITKEVTGTKASFSGIAQTGIANTANSVTASKTIVERSGSFSGNSGYLGVRRPYLIIERPRMCMPSNYQQLNGFPSMITMVLSECKGYTRVQQIQLTEVEATNPEQAEILELLKGGVIL